MKLFGLVNGSFLFLILGTSVPSLAQPTPQKQDAPPPIWIKKKPQPGVQQGAPMPQKNQMHQRAQMHQQPPPYQPPQQHRRYSGQPTVWQEHRAGNWQSEHRNWQDRGGYDGYQIPENRFRGRFGPGHAFRIHHYPVEVMEGRPHFQYGGYGFSVMDPLPEYWSLNWYNNDNVYIDYSGDGYYLYNRRYPQDRIAISVDIR